MRGALSPLEVGHQVPDPCPWLQASQFHPPTRPAGHPIRHPTPVVPSLPNPQTHQMSNSPYTYVGPWIQPISFFLVSR